MAQGSSAQKPRDISHAIHQEGTSTCVDRRTLPACMSPPLCCTTTQNCPTSSRNDVRIKGFRTRTRSSPSWHDDSRKEESVPPKSQRRHACQQLHHGRSNLARAEKACQGVRKSDPPPRTVDTKTRRYKMGKEARYQTSQSFEIIASCGITTDSRSDASFASFRSTSRSE